MYKSAFLLAPLLACDPPETCCDTGPGTGGDVLLPDVSNATFVSVVDNPYMPLPVGAKWTIEGQGTDEAIVIQIEVLSETRVVNGVTATVLRDTETIDGELAEDTWDWYAQDSDGNVWYLGEDTCEYERGECVDTHGAWEWGKDGALPGIVMWADPAAQDQAYYEEYYAGEAEDVGEVVGTGESVTVPAGTYSDCIKLHETTPLDPAISEYKHFCRGVGLVRAEADGEVEALTSTTLSP